MLGGLALRIRKPTPRMLRLQALMISKQPLRLSVAVVTCEPLHGIPGYVACGYRLLLTAQVEGQADRNVTQGNSVEMASDDQKQLMSWNSKSFVSIAAITTTSSNMTSNNWLPFGIPKTPQGFATNKWTYTMPDCLCLICSSTELCNLIVRSCQ